jgi:hypothetical protein
MGPVHAVIALAFGGVPALGIGLALLIAAKLWSEFERRRSERRLTRLLRSESADVRRYAVRSVADPSRHAGTLLQYRSVERDPENLRTLAEHVEGCRWSRSPSLDWLALRLWAIVFQSPSSTGGPWRPPETARGSTRVGNEDATAAPAAQLANESRVRGFGFDLAVAGGLGYAMWVVGDRVGAFNGFPKGYDALSHLATIRLVLDNFPHLLWNYAWYGGFPAYPGSYPPFYTLAVAAGVAASGSSIPHAMDVATAAIYIVATATLYGFVRMLGRNRFAAVAAAVILLGAPTLWSASLRDGSYPRLFAMAFIDLATLLAAWTARRPTRPRIALTAVALAIALGAHPVVGCLGVLQVTVVLLVAPPYSFERRLRLVVGVMAFVVGLSAWFYLPYVLRPHAYYLPAAPPALTTGTPAQIRSLLVIPTNQSLAALPAVLVPLTVLLGIGVAILLWRPRSAWRQSPEETRDRPWQIRRQRVARPLAVAGACLLPGAGCLAYAFVDYIHGVRLTFNGVFPYQILTYAVWPLAGAFGIALGAVLGLARSKTTQLVVGAVAVVVAVGSAAVAVPLFAPSTYTLYSSETKQLVEARPRTNEVLDERIAGTEDSETIWTSAYTRTPEIRGGFVQGILNPPDQYALETSLVDPAVPAAVRAFMVDWYGIEWIYTPTAATGTSEFGSEPGRYRLLEAIPGTPERTYQVLHPMPILSATAAPATLVIGSAEDYSLVLQGLALAGTPSTDLIPVEGTPYVDDYSLRALEQFPSIVLYGFRAHSPRTAAELLSRYVRHGGRLVVDVAGDGPLASAMSTAAPDAFPVTRWQNGLIGPRWGLRATPGPLTSGVDFSAFSPANWSDTGTWLTEVAMQWRRGATVVLRAQGSPVIVSARDEAGIVVMSGMNLPYHVAAFANATEAGFLRRMITGSAPGPGTVGQPSYRARINGADSAQVNVTSPRATGVLFKENDYPDWQATIDGNPATIYPAGPGMMYVRLAQGTSATVDLIYRLSPFEEAATAVTLLTMLALVLYIVVSDRSVAWLRRRVARRRPWNAPRPDGRP